MRSWRSIKVTFTPTESDQEKGRKQQNIRRLVIESMQQLKTYTMNAEMKKLHKSRNIQQQSDLFFHKYKLHIYYTVNTLN